MHALYFSYCPIWMIGVRFLPIYVFPLLNTFHWDDPNFSPRLFLCSERIKCFSKPLSEKLLLQRFYCEALNAATTGMQDPSLLLQNTHTKRATKLWQETKKKLRLCSSLQTVSVITSSTEDDSNGSNPQIHMNFNSLSAIVATIFSALLLHTSVKQGWRLTSSWVCWWRGGGEASKAKRLSSHSCLLGHRELLPGLPAG